MKQLREPSPHRPDDAVGQGVSVEEALLGDFWVGPGNLGLLPVSHHEEGDVIGWEHAEVCINTDELRIAREDNAGLLAQLPLQRGDHRLVLLNASAGKVPARPVRVADEKDAAPFIEHDALRAHREAARRTPVALHQHAGNFLQGQGGLLRRWRRIVAAARHCRGCKRRTMLTLARRVTSRTEAMTPQITIAHLSDVHLAPLAAFWPNYWNAKRFLGFANWMVRRRKSHLRAVVDLLTADLRHQHVDHIAVSGDLINIGLPQEYETALLWLHTLGRPDRVSVVPGNHDIYTRLRKHSGVGRWARYMESDDWGAELAPGSGPRFPYVRRIGDNIALVGLNSAVPTPPGIASGEVGREQIRDCHAVLEELGRRGMFRLVMIHHPPLISQVLPGRDLKDALELERALLDAGAELVIHGHNHRDMVSWHRTSGGLMPVIGIASASIGRVHRHEPLARYNIYRLHEPRSGHGWRIELIGRGIREPDGPVVQVERRWLEPAGASSPVGRTAAIVQG